MANGCMTFARKTFAQIELETADGHTVTDSCNKLIDLSEIKPEVPALQICYSQTT